MAFCKRRRQVDHGGLSPEDRARIEEEAMRKLVRFALSNAVEGRSGLEFERGCERDCLAGAEVGQKQHSRHFAGRLNL